LERDLTHGGYSRSQGVSASEPQSNESTWCVAWSGSTALQRAVMPYRGPWAPASARAGVEARAPVDPEHRRRPPSSEETAGRAGDRPRLAPQPSLRAEGRSPRRWCPWPGSHPEEDRAAAGSAGCRVEGPWGQSEPA